MHSNAPTVAEASFAPLLTLAQQISPALRGEASPLCAPALTPGCDNQASLHLLHEGIKQLNPEAGSPWWTARSWGLVSWQPLYLALLSVYGLQQLPSSFHQLSQQISPAMVSGFYLPPGNMLQADHHALLQQTACALRTLLTELRQQLADICTLPVGLANRLLSDQLLETMARLQTMRPDLTLHQVRHEAEHWLDALQLPLHTAQRLSQTTAGMPLHYQRQSCCMVYRCNSGELCDNCPRLKRRAA